MHPHRPWVRVIITPVAQSAVHRMTACGAKGHRGTDRIEAIIQISTPAQWIRSANQKLGNRVACLHTKLWIGKRNRTELEVGKGRSMAAGCHSVWEVKSSLSLVPVPRDRGIQNVPSEQS